MKLLLFKIVILGVLNLISATIVTPCSHYFHYELDDSNRVKSGIINLNLTSSTVDSGFTLEVVFGVKSPPVEVQDIPIVELLTQTSEIQEIIDRNDALKYGVTYNLEKPIPKLIKVVLHGPGIRDVREKLVCEEESDFTHQVQLRAFFDLDPVGRRRLNKTVPKFKLYKRHEWGARNSTRPLPILVKPVGTIVLMRTHTVDCRTVEECKDAVKDIQSYFMNQGSSDIPYNFLIGGDGNIYEGVGIEFQGNHTTGRNNDTLGLAFLGESKRDESNKKKGRVAQLLLETLIVEQNYVTPNYSIIEN